MATKPKKIARLQKGNRDRTMAHAEVANEVIDALNPLLEQKVIICDAHGAALKGASGEFKYSQGNVMLVLKGLGAASDEAAPIGFQLVDASTTAGGVVTHNIRVRLGGVAIPNNDSSIGPYPDGMSEGDDPPFILNDVGESGYVWLAVSVDVGTSEVTGLAVNFGSTIPSGSSGTGYLLLGSYGTDTEDTFYVYGAVGDQAYLYCGAHYFWQA